MSPGAGFGLVSTPWILLSEKSVADVSVGMCNQNKRLGDLSSVPSQAI